MRGWKRDNVLLLYQSLPQRVEDIGRVHGGSDDLSKLLKMGKVEIQTGRSEKKDVAIPVRRLTRKEIERFFSRN